MQREIYPLFFFLVQTTFTKTLGADMNEVVFLLLPLLVLLRLA